MDPKLVVKTGELPEKDPPSELISKQHTRNKSRNIQNLQLRRCLSKGPRT
jgi:hypothetical protein